MKFNTPDNPYYTGEVNISHNTDLLIVAVQTTERLSPDLIKQHPHLESNPYMYRHIEINKNNGEIEKTYTAPFDF